MFKSVLIAGAGTMGRGVAELMAMAGFEVQLWDHRSSALGRASAAIERSLRKQYEIGRVSLAQLEDALGNIRLLSDYKIVHPRTELVLEAIVEELDAKKEVLGQIESRLPDAWFVTHTASISIQSIADGLKRPERLIGMHFFNPAPVMPLVEVVYSIRTDKEWIRRATELAEKRLGKESIIVRDTPGFASSRLSTSMALEAMRMLEQGVATIEDIDKAMEYGYRHPMGPLRLSDWIGLDVRLNVARILHKEFGGETFRPPRVLERLVEEGKFGRKSGEGFYKWPKEI